MVAIPERGRLEETPFPRLLLDLYRARFAGTLTLARERVGKRFLFHEGVPVYAESNLASESLGVQLMDAGKLSRADYHRVVVYVERERCKEGKALLDLELIDARGLFVALKDQVRIRLLECFGWPCGEFHVDPSAQPSPDAQPLRIDLAPLLQEGIAAHWSTERILADLAPSMDRYPRPGRRFEDLARRLLRDDSVEALLAGLDGERTLWKAMQAARTPRALAAAWVLHEAGGLALADAPAGAEAAPPEVDLVVDALARSEARREPRASEGDRRGREARGEEKPSGGGPPLPPRPTDAQALAALRREIDEHFERLGTVHHYALLGVPQSADAATIKHAYHRAAKTYHPDALARAGLDAETRRRANRVFAEIGKAHAVLSDPARRRDYDASLAGDGEAIDADRLANAETNYRKGEILLRQGKFRAALDYLRAAVELWPDEAAYQSALGWAFFKKTPSEPQAARQHLERALAVDSRDAVARSRLAAVLRALGDEAAASDAQERSPR
jgi:tetratricopeptide (TPR) repeat protein